MSKMGEGVFGQGHFGGEAVGTAIDLHVVDGSKTPLALTLGWTQMTGIGAYRLYKNDQPISFSWDGTKKNWRVAYKTGDHFELIALTDAIGGQVQV